MSWVARSLRGGMLAAAQGLGVNRALAASGWRRRRLLILCYHGFALRDEHRWDPELFMSRATFRGRLALLRQHRFAVLPLGEALQRLREGSLPPRAVCLTVDDGLYDFKAVALPLLEEFGFPATLYVSTYYVEHPWPVFNPMVSYLLWLGAGRGPLHWAFAGDGANDLSDPRRRAALTETIKTRAEQQGLDGAAKHALLEDLARTLGLDYAELCRSRILSLLRPEELAGLGSPLVDVQLHTHRHRVPEDHALFLREISENRDALARAGHHPAQRVHFCYPSGVHRPVFLPWLREAGVVSATTTEAGLAGRAGDPLLLPRFIDTERTPEREFLAWGSGLRAMLNRRTLGF